ncbi:TetR/AcrR family transcriptional regulator [Gordonia sp. FQ]|uniref:TetR/AcrR family transcriptional regulator n=1 Tax=Gordonia sp. FQ TaxID=3446634 RepID=UPI003F847497
MSNPPRPAHAARAAVTAAATLTRELEQRLLGPAVDAVASDGRKQRWARHKEERRSELIAGTMTAIRDLGPEAGMDEIARHIGVSKTVLYRYFSDKSDLSGAVADTFIQSRMLPRLSEALTEDLGDYELVRTVIAVYVHIISAEPNLYRYCTASNAGTGTTIASAQRIFADAIESTLRTRLTVRQAETAGAGTWALAMVGGVEVTVGRWLDTSPVDADRLIDELTMLIWGGVAGIVGAGGSPARFTAAPPALPPLPGAEPA